MKLIFYSVLIFSQMSLAANREDLKKGILAGCIKNSRQSAVQKSKTCECVSRNLANHKDISDEDMEILAKVYSAVDPEKVVMNYESKTLLFTYDTQAAEHCMKNSRWSFSAEEKEK